MKEVCALIVISLVVECYGQCIDLNHNLSTGSSVFLVTENVTISTRDELWRPLCEIKDHNDVTCVALKDDENGKLNLSFPPDSSSFSLLLPDSYLEYAKNIRVKCSTNNEVVNYHYSDNPDSDQFELTCSLEKCLDVNIFLGIAYVCEINTHKHRDPFQAKNKTYFKFIGPWILAAVFITVYLVLVIRVALCRQAERLSSI